MRYFNTSSFLIVSLAVVCFVAGCAKVNEEQLLLDAEQQELCEKDTISFHDHIAPLISANCMPCHSNAQQEGFIILETYNDISGLAATGYLVGVVKHDPGFKPMPNNRPQLRQCEVRAIETWVNQGALNN